MKTEAFLKSLNINFNRYQIVELYMAMGGIPHYLNEVETGLSAAQNIERICFSPSGLLNNEFSRLYPALFENADNHIAVIKALEHVWKFNSVKLSNQNINLETTYQPAHKILNCILRGSDICC